MDRNEFLQEIEGYSQEELLLISVFPGLFMWNGGFRI